MKRLYIYIIAIFALCSCLKGEETFDTLLVVRPSHQATSDSAYEWLEGCVTYAFEGLKEDETIDLWSFESYDDALNGVITNTESGEKINAIAKGEPYTFPTEIDPNLLPENYDPDYDPEEDDDDRVYEYGVGAMAMNVQTESIILLVVDPSSMSYGYTPLKIGMSLTTTFVSILFRDWKYDSYTQGKWIFHSPAAPVVDPTDPTVE